MTTPTRRQVLEDNYQRRQGNVNRPRDTGFGEVAFKIPTGDWPALVRMYPDLASHDRDTRMQAFRDLRSSPFGEKYLVGRTPRQVRLSPNSRVIIK